VVVDGFDPERELFRFQFGDGGVRWTRLRDIERAWKGADHALLRVWPPGASVTAELQSGVEMEREGRTAEAAELYRRVLAEHPAELRAWVNLGNAEAAQGRRAEAEAAYRSALKLSPADPDALNNLAWLLLQEGSRLDEAEGLAEGAARTPGEDQSQAQDTLGRIQLARGRCADATRTFRDALVTGGTAPSEARANLLEGLGRALQTCGSLDDARESFREALRAGASPATARAAQRALDTLAAQP